MDYQAIEAAIKLLTERITAQQTPDDALKLTQAALNLAQAKAALAGVTKT